MPVGADTAQDEDDCGGRKPVGVGVGAPGATTGGANKNPKMGYAIGYLRKHSKSGQNHQSSSKSDQHEYHMINDAEEDFGGPLDLGPSFLDEVFNELETSHDDQHEVCDQREGGYLEKRRVGQSVMDLVSTALKKHERQQAGKQQATVKPIKASDERKLDEAIAMANMLASKSMHDLDKKHADEEEPALTPTSPSKKFTFRFATSKTHHGHSPKAERRHFTEEARANADMESLLTPGAVDAYKALIEAPASPPRVSTGGDNPLPLPPKSKSLSLQPAPKRHVRKNPLIIASGAAASLLRHSGDDEQQVINGYIFYVVK